MPLLDRMPNMPAGIRLTTAERDAAVRMMSRLVPDSKEEQHDKPPDMTLLQAHLSLHDVDEELMTTSDAKAAALAADQEAEAAAAMLVADDHGDDPEGNAAPLPGSAEAIAAAEAAEADEAAEAAAAEAEARAADDSDKDWAVVDESDVGDFALRVPYPAATYPFELDAFQKRAVLRLEQAQDVFVSAHTSSGKTVVAEYAVALALRHRARAVYTSPVKALSNQKYRELSRRFGEASVGLITGDVSLNPTAPCLIVTTEILRGMIHRNAAAVSEADFVIFDEIHYINDIERGVVVRESPFRPSTAARTPPPPPPPSHARTLLHECA
jgi:superfamily II RNA helicase